MNAFDSPALPLVPGPDSGRDARAAVAALARHNALFDTRAKARCPGSIDGCRVALAEHAHDLCADKDITGHRRRQAAVRLLERATEHALRDLYEGGFDEVAEALVCGIPPWPWEPPVVPEPDPRTGNRRATRLAEDARLDYGLIRDR